MTEHRVRRVSRARRILPARRRSAFATVLAVVLAIAGSAGLVAAFVPAANGDPPGAASVPCPLCGGRGRRPCEACDGRGVETPTRTSCASCGGQGSVACEACLGRGTLTEEDARIMHAR